MRKGNLESEEFVPKEGLRQGEVLRPTLFNVILDILKEIKTSNPQIGYQKNINGLQTSLIIWENYIKEWNMRIHTEKTKIMTIGKDEINIQTKLDGRTLEQLVIYKYLGIYIHKD